MLTINELSVSYGKHLVLEGIDLSVDSPGIHGIAGLNGSGKTTLLNTIFGLKDPDSGQVLFSGAPIQGRQIAFLEATNYFYPRITGREYLELFRLQNPSFDLEGWRTLFDLPLDEFIHSYSTGMKKKLALLGVICLNPSLYLLDEPYNGLDLESSRRLLEILQILREKGRTVIVTSHVLETLTRVCDTISILRNKRIEQTFMRETFDQLEGALFQNQEDATRELMQKL